MTARQTAAIMPMTPDATARRAALALIAGLTVVRLLALIVTPLELYPDEAQYWLWSRELAFGYFSKPPMIAWLIALTTKLGGDAEPYVRASAVFLNAGTALCLFFLGRRLYGPWTGFFGAAFFLLMPAASVGSLVISADTPALFFSSLGLLAYASVAGAEGQEGGSQRRIALAIAVGLAFGLAMLSKYSALYAIGGLALHLILDRRARAAWTPPSAAAAVAVFALILAPHVLWNASHGFETVAHTASNANWGGRLFNLKELGEFLGGQLGVFGPVPLGVLVFGAVLAIRHRTLAAPDRLLLCVILPPLAVVTVQAFISRANINWAVIAYPPAAVLVAAWLLRWKARPWLIAAIAIQGVVLALFLAVILSPRFADTVGASRSLKRMRGWDETTQQILNRAQVEQAVKGVTAIAVDDRLMFFAVRYYGRDYFARPDAAPLRKWSSGGPPSNQAEVSAGLTPADGGRVLAVSMVESKKPDMVRDFAAVSDESIVRVRLDRKQVRRLELFIGEGFRTAAPVKPVGVKPVPAEPADGR